MEQENMQETKKCKYCQSDIPKAAKICPNCRKKQGGKLKGIVIAAVVVIVLIAIIGGGSSDQPTASKVGENGSASGDQGSQESVQTSFSVGDIVETETLRITYKSAEIYEEDNEFSQPKDGYVYYRMEFEFENISDSDEYASYMDFECYADGYSMDAHYGDDDLSATLSAGKKCVGAVYFEVPEDAAEITLEYETNYWTGDKVIFVVK